MRSFKKVRPPRCSMLRTNDCFNKPFTFLFILVPTVTKSPSTILLPRFLDFVKDVQIVNPVLFISL